MDDLKIVNELSQANQISQAEVLHKKLNDKHETKTETQKVNDDSTLKICLYDLYDWIKGVQTFDCPVRQKYPETTKEEMAKIYCKNCPRKILTIMYKKAKMNPPKTERWKSHREKDEDFEPFRQEPTWQNNPTSGRVFDLDDKNDVVHKIARDSLR